MGEGTVFWGLLLYDLLNTWHVSVTANSWREWNFSRKEQPPGSMEHREGTSRIYFRRFRPIRPKKTPRERSLFTAIMPSLPRSDVTGSCSLHQRRAIFHLPDRVGGRRRGIERERGGGASNFVCFLRTNELFKNYKKLAVRWIQFFYLASGWSHRISLYYSREAMEGLQTE